MSVQSELDEAFASINTWSRGEQRAVHKPLLLLLALGRVQKGLPRLVAFREIEEQLRTLLRGYGPYRKADHPEYPFWRLQNDGFWEVPEAGALETRASNTDAKLTELRAHGSGGFQEPVQKMLVAGGKELLGGLALGVLRRHFPTTYHAPLVTDVGLALDVETTSSVQASLRRAVLERSDSRCEVCGTAALLQRTTAGLGVQLLRWSTHGGEFSPENAVAVCNSHSDALAFGAVAVGEDGRLLVSPRVPTGSRLQNLVRRDFSAAHLGLIAEKSAEWHRTQVFKGPAGS